MKRWVKGILFLVLVSGGSLQADTFDADMASDLFVVDNAGRAVWYEASGTSYTQTILTGYATSVAVGNLDGDAAMDLVVGKNQIIGSGVTFATFYESTGNNTLAWRKNLNDTNAFGATSLSLGDLDGDGKGNLMVVRANSALVHYEGIPDNIVYVGGILNTGVSILLGDFDGDATCDFFVGRTDQHNWYESNGTDNGFVGVKNVSGSYGAPVKNWALGDYDADGAADLFMLMGGANEGRIRRFEATGNNTWVERANIVLPGTGRNCLAIGDLNNDGTIELLVGTDSGINLYQDGKAGSVGSLVLDAVNPGVKDMQYVQAVPEPATLSLIALGAVGVMKKK